MKKRSEPIEWRPWTIPNLLTFGRLISLPFLIMAILDGRKVAALVIFLAASISDWVDGFLARRFQMGSPLGAFLDPIADKLFLVSTFVVFALPSTPSKMHMPLWLLLLALFRDLLIVVVSLVLFLALEIRSFPPSFLGKATTFAEISTVVAIMLNNVDLMPDWVPITCFFAAGGLIIVSGIHYSWRAATQQSPKPTENGAA
ncbi:MAG: CDP-alcohol phosphatidyltransferase family protein [Thermoanaerobaculia bacterium]|nr:putative CDP-diacylglycerol--glycerol-3-phosphate 3-phosphatidyl-transferase 1 [Thermoanaerobaculia bacterium]MCK6683495.1 CDP-alcohol phosphatidyltransferase family protein [Thermoanaerobaculia bacterium]